MLLKANIQYISFSPKKNQLMKCHARHTTPPSHFFYIFTILHIYLLTLFSIFTITKLFHTGRVWEHRIHFNIDFRVSVLPFKRQCLPKTNNSVYHRGSPRDNQKGHKRLTQNSHKLTSPTQINRALLFTKLPLLGKKKKIKQSLNLYLKNTLKL